MVCGVGGWVGIKCGVVWGGWVGTKCGVCVQSETETVTLIAMLDVCVKCGVVCVWVGISMVFLGGYKVWCGVCGWV